MSAILAGAVLSGAPGTAGTARAAAGYPVGNAPVLTHNPLYGRSVFTQVACEEPAAGKGGAASARRYTLAVVKCLDRVWSTELRRRNLPFRRPVVRFVSTRSRVCGEKWPKETIALYCRAERSLNFPVGSGLLDNDSDLFLLIVAAHEYAHHVQNLSGIMKGNDGLAYRNKKELNEQARRQELQAECLAGAFAGSVWTSLARTAADWRLLLRSQKATGDDSGGRGVRDHGKGSSIVYWTNRGFRAASSSACNTWTAASARVS
nr:neutral zinc metallopeptidase [Planomonospora venezuelensis]